MDPPAHAGASAPGAHASLNRVAELPVDVPVGKAIVPRPARRIEARRDGLQQHGLPADVLPNEEADRPGELQAIQSTQGFNFTQIAVDVDGRSIDGRAPYFNNSCNQPV